jgi:hypothetical protein
MFAIHRKAQIFGRATAAVLSAPLITATDAAPIPAGPNYFETVPAGTSIDFGRGNIIRRGFFDPGSDGFIGGIRLQGDPVDPRALGTTDTIMQRLEDINISQNERLVTDLGLALVSLVSVNPITVTYNGGTIPSCGVPASRSSPIKSSGGAW